MFFFGWYSELSFHGFLVASRPSQEGKNHEKPLYYSEKSMFHLSSFSKIVYINTPLDEIKKRIGQGQQRGLAAPEGLSIDEIYLEREPLYKKWADTTLNGKDSVENLLSTILSFI